MLPIILNFPETLRDKGPFVDAFASGKVVRFNWSKRRYLYLNP